MIRRLGWWILVALLPAVALAVIIPRGSQVPEPYIWRHPQGIQPPQLLWDRWLDFRGEPNLFVERALRLLSLDCEAIGLSRMPLFGWLMATLTSFGLIFLGKPWRGGNASPLVGAGLVLALGTWVFSPVFGASWLLGERIGLFAPATAAVFAILLLRRERSPRVALLSASLVCGLAAFSHASGAIIWAALVPLVLTTRRSRGRPALPALTLWCFLGCLGVALSRFHLSPQQNHNFDPVSLFTRKSWDMGIRMAGSSVPQTSLMPEARDWMGVALLVGALLILVAAWFTREKIGLWASGWPSIALAGAFFCLAEGCRLGASTGDDALFQELSWSGLLLPIGVFGCALPLLKHHATLLLTLAIAGIGGLGAANEGWSRLDERARFLDYGAAVYRFSRLSDLQMPTTSLMDESRLQQRRDAGSSIIRAPFESSELLERLEGAELDETLRIDDLRTKPTTLVGYRADDPSGFTCDLLLAVRWAEDRPPRLLATVQGPAASKPWSIRLAKLTGEAGDHLLVFAFDSRSDRFKRATGSPRFDGEVYRLGEKP